MVVPELQSPRSAMASYLVLFVENRKHKNLRLETYYINIQMDKTMGWWIWEDDPATHGRFCCDSGYFRSWENFYALAHGRNGRHSQCAACNSYHRKWRYEYRHDHKVPKQCEGCGRARYLEVDHDHETNQFRRWLCRSCNRLDRRWHRT